MSAKLTVPNTFPLSLAIPGIATRQILQVFDELPQKSEDQMKEYHPKVTFASPLVEVFEYPSELYFDEVTCESSNSKIDCFQLGSLELGSRRQCVSSITNNSNEICLNKNSQSVS